MSEKEPLQPRFYIDAHKENIECVPENTFCFLYEDTKYDHIFHVIEDTEEGYNGYYIWREMLGEKFDTLAKYMIDAGYVVDNCDELDEHDMEAYYRAYPDEISLPQRELTPRQERFMSYFNYLLLNGHITAEEFLNGTSNGELHI